MPKERFQSGQCFTSSAKVSNAALVSSMAARSRPIKKFVAPSRTNPGAALTSGSSRGVSSLSAVSAAPSVKPRHDPQAPNAVVMPRPPADHQRIHNRKNLPVVDVVLDPLLARHLRPHQRVGVQFLYECVMGYRDYDGQGAILADEMGLGKTLQAITLLWTLLKQTPYHGAPVCKRIMIVCPATLVGNWAREIKKWLGDERLKPFIVTTPTSNAAKDMKASDASIRDFLLGERVYPVMVVGYERLRTVSETLKNTVKFDLIICDEGHRLKSATIKTSQALASFGCRRRIILSGTPIQNDLGEYFAMADFVNPGVLGSAATFRKVFEEPIVKSRREDATEAMKQLGQDRSAELARLTNLFVLRRTAEINQQYLPPKTDIILFCRLSPLQIALYKHILQNPILNFIIKSTQALDMDGQASGGHLVCLNALRKVVNCPEVLYKAALERSIVIEGDKENGSILADADESGVYDGVLELMHQFAKTDEANMVSVNDAGELKFEVASSGKLHVLKSLLEQTWAQDPSVKFVIVSNFTQTLDVIETLLRRAFTMQPGPTGQYFRLDGSTPTSKRMDMVTKFNQPASTSSSRVFLLSSKSGGTGLNLIGASHLILFDSDWNPATDAQAMARIWRDGNQASRVVIYRMVSAGGSVDERVWRRGVGKQSLSKFVLDTEHHSGSGGGGGIHIDGLSGTVNGKAKDGMDKLTKKELRSVFSGFDERGDCETHRILGCKCPCNGSFDSSPPHTTTNNTTTDPDPDVNNDVKERTKKRKLMNKQNDTTNLMKQNAWLSEWKHLNPDNATQSNPDTGTDTQPGPLPDVWGTVDPALATILGSPTIEPSGASMISFIMFKQTLPSSSSPIIIFLYTMVGQS